MDPLQITLYGRPGCELCGETEASVRALIASGQTIATLSVVDIEQDQQLHARLVEQIPALQVADKLLPLAVGARRIAAFLRAAEDRSHGER